MNVPNQSPWTDGERAKLAPAALRSLNGTRKDRPAAPLARVWDYLKNLPRLSSIATIRRPVNRAPLTTAGEVRGSNRKNTASVQDRDLTDATISRAVRPIHGFECPPVSFPSTRPRKPSRSQAIAPWDGPRILVHQSGAGRSPWRLVACTHFDGMVCDRHAIAIGPADATYLVALTAVLNGPLANAYVAAHAARGVTLASVSGIPIPPLSAVQREEIERLVDTYLDAVHRISSEMQSDADLADQALRRIDALVLEACGLPPRLERELLDFFRGAKRGVPFPFADYFPIDFRPCFSLKVYLSSEFQQSTAGVLRALYAPAPPAVRRAMNAAVEAFGE